MKKIIRIKNLCCANCGAKIERGIEKIEGVKEVALNFMLQKIVLEVEEDAWERVAKEIVTIARKIEPDCEIVL